MCIPPPPSKKIYKFRKRIAHGRRVMMCDVCWSVAALAHFIYLFVFLVLPVSEKL